MNIYKNPPKSEWDQLLKRPVEDLTVLEDLVKNIFREVKINGDKAVREFTRKFDGNTLDSLKVSPKEFHQSADMVTDELKNAIATAASNIRQFHEAQVGSSTHIEPMKGVECWQEFRAIEKVGLYVPGGTAPLFSTLLMLAIPAQISGCREIQVCTPAGKDGKIHPAILYCCHYLGLKDVFKVGGIQAIAAFTYGTETISRAYKLFGPGNQYVTAAKMWATMEGVPIDMPAGPSEVLVCSDASGNAEWIASDLLSQAEHGPDSQVIFITTSEPLIEETRIAMGIQMARLPRKSIISVALQHARAIYFEEEEMVFDFINQYAPEHLILNIHKPEEKLHKIQNAGSVFIGPYSPESAGDYASGTNHTLPTYGQARVFGGLSVRDFMKNISFQKITLTGLENLAPAIIPMAAAEQLEGHKNAVTIRLKSVT